MSAPNLVIVESPAKGKTINKYLGPEYEVIASYGHVRDLPPKDGSVDPENGFAMVWTLGDRAAKPVGDIKRLVKKAKAVYLATDPDREGEAISWHINEILKDGKLLEGKTIKRVTFNEITKKAVQEAFLHAREIDSNLIDAYMARRALDYLVGFNISPVLWRKLPGSRSAGRVQSVALRLICQRETEIEAFRADEYWTIEARLHSKDGAPFTARLTTLAGNRLDKLDIGTEALARAAVQRIKTKTLKISSVEKKQVRRFPAAPFITSTLQQEASRKLGFAASQTMRLAQRLYEGIDIGGDTVGLITYMRTDGVTLSDDAIAQVREVIGKNYGGKYLPGAPRIYKSKVKNAQEAHEAIRPTDLSRTPDQMRPHLDDQMAKLYDLIWKRTMASQMENAILDQVGADISDGTDDVVLRATGSTVAFDGFLTLYTESTDDDDADEENRRLPPLHEGDPARLADITPEQHFTQPPPRFSEASLVKRMEELGIGRPSTYASILQVLQDRKYVTLDKKRFFPEDRGRLVTAFLEKYFTKYVDYDFTANLEEELDAIADGHVKWKTALKQFWSDFTRAIGATKDLTITQVIDHLNEALGRHFFPPHEDGSDPRLCPACNKGQLSLKLGKFGAFVGCSNYPDCRFTRPLILQEGNDGDQSPEDAAAAAALANEPKILGEDPATGKVVSMRRGPYGPYVQIDEPEGSKDKPKRQGVPKGVRLDDVTLQSALKLLELPRDVGTHPVTGEMIKAGVGRFGPFLLHQKAYTSIPKSDDVLTIGMNRAVDLITAKAERMAANPGKGRWGKKKTDGKTNDKTDDRAETKAPVKVKAPAKKAAPKKPAAKKSPAKKTAVKKPAVKKVAVKKAAK